MPLITIRSLPTIGRAGNQMHLYCFAKAYALKHGCDFEVPGWWGNSVLCNANEPKPSRILPQTELDSISAKNGRMGYFFGQVNIDIRVYAQHQAYIDFFTVDQCREWLKLKPELDFTAESEYSAMHLRRGDYASPEYRNSYCEVSDSSYDRAIDDFGIPQPVIKVCENWKEPQDKFKQLGVEWIEDFITLRNASHLLRGNSTFSWWAATLGNGKVYSPVVGAMTGKNDCKFVEGNWPTTAGKFKNQSDLHIK